jgi:hypothetical protein
MRCNWQLTRGGDNGRRDGGLPSGHQVFEFNMLRRPAFRFSSIRRHAFGAHDAF